MKIERIEQLMNEYFENVEIETPEMEQRNKELLDRMVKRNSPDYDFSTDELLVADCIETIAQQVRPLVLTDEQKKFLAIRFEEITSLDDAYKLTDEITQSLHWTFFEIDEE